MRARRRWMTPLLSGAAALAAAGVTFGLLAGSSGAVRPGAGAPSATDGSGPGPSAPSWVLTDQNGHRVSSAAFRGKVQVVSFLFPFCTSYCPVTARSMTELEQELAHTPLHDKVQLVAFNVDPAGASPAHMRAFWTEFGGNPADPGASFLTGSPAAVRHVVTDGFHVYYEKVTDAQQQAGIAKAKADGTYQPEPKVSNSVAASAHVDYDVVHNDVIEIVGPDGHIRRVFDNASQVGEAELKAAVVAAAAGR